MEGNAVKLAWLLLFSAPLFAQFSRPVSYFPYDPVGGCSSNSNLWNNTGGHLYKCRGSSWTIVDGAASSFTDLLAGTNTKALTMGTGGVLSYAGGIVNANFLLGVNLSSITGVVKMTTGIASPVAGSAGDCVKVDGSSGPCGGLGSLTGVIKATSGTPAVVTGSAGDCVHVDAGSAPCGGASAALTALGTITTAPAIAGGSGTVLTITATLGANITCGTISGFTAGQFLTLKLTNDGTPGRTFTCAGMANLGTVAPDAGKTSIQTFYAPTSSTLQAAGPMWCFDCAPGIILPEGTPSGAVAGSSVLGANSSTHTLQVSNNNSAFHSVCYLFASGAIALNTTLIASADHSLKTVSVTGTLTTDTIEATVNGSLIATTGYIPSTNGMLGIYVYPTADNINADVVNNGTMGVTPGAVTLNYKITRCN